ncbi:MAG: murein biosynthesis integral membrane protein MurJ, partial [Deltaproteobacteria bacterium]|nr:murein biosynthesis integral membrane protein MurJ [Deltaproteobacteria bacterium]
MPDPHSPNSSRTSARPKPGEASKSEAAQTLYGSAGVVTFFTLVSRVLGMVRDLVIAHRFGAG